ncbi:hypothetical protein [Cyclobacterium sp. SYSU L10401]|uniref:hypothetical protein n=1 Tax=Cyclobacterium sp. SYSU L10401 TaxID=2678657 RepID=UPI00293BBC05|nr:hypothetical protein [Cyclobacterium sp. SYSU L10401]
MYAAIYRSTSQTFSNSGYITVLYNQDWVDRDENIYVPQWASQKTYPVKLERV